MAKAKTQSVGPLSTPEGRLSFIHFTAPETTGQYPCNKYVGTLIMPAGAPSNFEPLKAACLMAAQLQWPDKGITALGQIRLPFRDGNEKAAASPVYANTIYIKCKSQNKPAIVTTERIIGPDGKVSFAPYTGQLKSGDYARFSVTAWPFRMNLEREMADALRAAGKTIFQGTDEQNRPFLWRPAVALLLNAVQFTREGEALGGSGGGTSAFDDGEAPAAQAAGRDIFS